ncbi:MAG: calcium/sodium antiporter [Pseudomonadota bacterium]
MINDIALVIGGLVLLVAGADRFVVGAATTARNLGISPILIGLTIVGFATSAPEILVSATASIKGSSMLAVGNAIGSNIANIALVLGLVAVLHPVEVKSQTLMREMPVLLAVTLLTLSLFLDDYLSRVDGAVLIGTMGVVMYWIVRLATTPNRDDPIDEAFDADIPSNLNMKMSIFWLAVGLLALLLGAELLVRGATELARVFGVSELVIGVTLVAIGTSLPELAVSIISVLRGEYGLVVGNVIGSNIFNLVAVIGVAALIQPTGMDPNVLTLHFFVMSSFTLVLFAMAYTYSGVGYVNRVEGLILVIAFVAYHYYVITNDLAMPQGG